MPKPDAAGCTCGCPDCRKRQHHLCENKFHAAVYQQRIDDRQAALKWLEDRGR